LVVIRRLPAAASFKHVSPAGAAVYVPLTEELIDMYDVAGKDLSPQAIVGDVTCHSHQPVSVSTVSESCLSFHLPLPARYRPPSS
jgi:phosphoribosylaminoimidazolecarboxamide formyltransferase/IMP cyclohydrolase